MNDNFKETKWKQSEEIIVHEKRAGDVEVYYLKKTPEFDEGPFLKEERDLISAIAERLGKIIERKLAEEALAKARDELELRVVERTNELAEVNVKLQDDITQRKRAESELEESRDQLRSLSAHLQSVRQDAKVEIAREIHDELWQNLTVLKMDLSWQKSALRKDQKLLQEESAAMTEMTDSMIQTVKKMLTKLRPPLLDHLGVVAALEWETGKFKERTGIGCNLKVDPEEIDLDPDRAMAVYRIFEQSLTIIARHAQATAVKVSLKVDSGQVVMDIVYNGIG